VNEPAGQLARARKADLKYVAAALELQIAEVRSQKSDRRNEMSLKLTIPTALRRLTGDADVVEVEPGTIQEIIARLDEYYSGFRNRVCEDDGKLRRFINIYVDGEDIRFLDNLSTQVKDGSELSIILAIAGG
jgi:sulfur-carrier protein